MEINNLLSINNKEDFYNWLIDNSTKEKECFLILKRGKPIDKNTFYYLDAVEVTLCFGWIDSLTKKVNGVTYQRFTPRKKNSPWSELNKERVRRLIKLGYMTNEGYKVLPNLDEDNFVIDKDIIKLMKENDCYEIFKSFPPLYQRVRIYNIMFYKNRNAAMYKKSLNHFIEETKKGKMFGQWNDYGRLLNY